MWRGLKHIPADRTAYLCAFFINTYNLCTLPGWTKLVTAGAFASTASLSTGLGLLLFSPSTYAQYREIIAATQWYSCPLLMLDSHLILERARTLLPLFPSRIPWLLLLFKWPPYLLLAMAFPVVAAWIPLVQLVSLFLMNLSSLHALAVYGNELLASPLVLQTCKAAEAALTQPVRSATGMCSSAVAHSLFAVSAEDGQAASCRRYVFGMWLLCQYLVFWLTLLWHARRERKEREQFLHTLGFEGSVTWPMFRVMLMEILAIQAFVTILFMLFLEDIVEGPSRYGLQGDATKWDLAK
eukprot:jgi/Botrbrau1/15184/Bobra.0149s0049.1